MTGKRRPVPLPTSAQAPQPAAMSIVTLIVTHFAGDERIAVETAIAGPIGVQPQRLRAIFQNAANRLAEQTGGIVRPPAGLKV